MSIYQINFKNQFLRTTRPRLLNLSSTFHRYEVLFCLFTQTNIKWENGNNIFVVYTFISGISGKSQILFALVYFSRYLDLFTSFISPYNSIMKVFFIASSLFTVYLMYFKFRATYDSNHDTFRMEFLVVPVGGLAFLVNHDFSPLEVNHFILLIFTKCAAWEKPDKRHFKDLEILVSSEHSFHGECWMHFEFLIILFNEVLVFII